ncbi:MAG: sugar MFS transporter [Sandaracinaceae bacterium]
MPYVASAEVRASFELSYGAAMGWLFVLPTLVALVLEPPLFVLADRYPRRWFVLGGLAAMAAAAFLLACSIGPFTLSLALSVMFVGSGMGVGLAQATLVDLHPGEGARVLARWNLAGELGDMVAPLLLGLFAWLELDWRAAFVVVGALLAAWTAFGLAQRFEAEAETSPEEGGEEPEPGVLDAVREALGSRRLVGWLGVAAVCELLDEIVVVLAALHLKDDLGIGEMERSLVFGAGVAGAIIGSIASERALARVSPMKVLFVVSAACSVAFGLFWMSHDVWTLALGFAVVCATAAPMYPIAQAEAYAALPGRSGTVNAAAHLYTPLTLALPFLLGALADAAGPGVALAVLIAQPLVLLVVSGVQLYRNRESTR